MNRSKIYISEAENARILEIIEESKEAIYEKLFRRVLTPPSEVIQAVSDSIRARLSREIVVVSPKISG